LPETEAPGASADYELLKYGVLEAGHIARHYFEKGFEHWDKAKDDPVTEADLAVDRVLKEILLSDRPTYGWLSEETDDDLRRLSCRRVWIVDPIDGTRAFVERRPQFTICAALVDNGEPECAFVYNPVTEQLFEARRGRGARLNGDPIAPSARSELEGASVLATKGMFKHPDWQHDWPDLKISMRNSVALRLALVACGEFDMCLSLTKKSDWDLAAADLIVREAGARLSDHTGLPFRYNRKSVRQRSLIATCPGLYEEILKRTRHLTLPD